MLGHSPILSLRLNTSLYWYNKSLTCSFSALVKHELFRFTYLSNISLSVMYFLSSVLSNHGNFPSDFSSSFLTRFTSLLYWSHTLSATQNDSVCLNVLEGPLVLFCRNLMILNLQLPSFPFYQR